MEKEIDELKYEKEAIKEAKEIIKEELAKTEKEVDTDEPIDEEQLVPKEKVYSLMVTAKELQNSEIKRALSNLITLKIGLQRANPYFTISKAELEVLERMPTFVSIKRYPKKFKKEVGKIKGKRVVLRE